MPELFRSKTNNRLALKVYGAFAVRKLPFQIATNENLNSISSSNMGNTCKVLNTLITRNARLTSARLRVFVFFFFAAFYFLRAAAHMSLILSRTMII